MSVYVAGAVKLCVNPKFWRYLNTLASDPVNSPADAARELRALCGIHSRKELATNAEARKVYEQLIKQFNAHLSGGR